MTETGQDLPHDCRIEMAPDGRTILLGNDASGSVDTYSAIPLLHLALFLVRMENRGHGDALDNLAEVRAFAFTPLDAQREEVLRGCVAWLRKHPPRPQAVA